MTLVDRRTSCILGWAVTHERSEAIIQHLVDKAPQAAFYFSDLLALCRRVAYALGLYTPLPDKSETFRVEGVNADLRHYLARLARQSRCFSRHLAALHRGVKLFVFACNRRQLYRQRFPNTLPTSFISCVPDLPHSRADSIEPIHVIHTPLRAPNANAVAERWVRSVRNECLDKLLIVTESHLRRVLREYVSYFNGARPH